MAAGESGSRGQAAGRFFSVEPGMGMASGWYVETREGLRGPFPTREDAEAELQWVIQSHPRRRVNNWHGGHMGR